jgi:predicted nucleic acid-binding protein
VNAPVFVDTNVFVYASASQEPLKQPLAAQWLEHLWKEQLGRTSMQVLNEYYWSVTRKIRPALPTDEAWDNVRDLLAWHPQPIDADVLLRAHEIERRFGLGWWDSLIVGAAQAQKCVILLTEDLQNEALYGGVTIRNPFVIGISEALATYSAAPEAVRRFRGRGRPPAVKIRSG